MSIDPLSLDIRASHAGKIDLSPVLTDVLKPLRIPGSTCLGASGSFGHLLYQQLKGEDISIKYVNLFFREEDELTYRSEEPALRLQVALRNSFYYDAIGLGACTLHERGFTLNYVPCVEHRMRLRPSASYTSFAIYYKIEHFLPLQNSFPGLTEFLDKVKAGEAAQFNSGYCIASVNMSQMIERILACNYTGSLRTIYLNSAAIEVLVLALVRIKEDSRAMSAAMTKQDVEEIYTAKEYLIGNIGKSFSLDKLATKMGLSPYKLNNGFRAIYGMSVTEWLLEIRMERAHKLLQETDQQVSRVAKDSGYSHPNAFSLAFTKYFGYTPAFVQKGRRFAS